MNKSLQGRFRKVIHNNYILYYFVYMYTQLEYAMKTHSSGVSPTDVPATSYVKFYYEGTLIKSVLCH